MVGKVLWINRNKIGVHGVIECSDGSTYYYDTASIVKGNLLKKGSEVDFEIVSMVDGRTKADRVQIHIKKRLEAEEKKKFSYYLMSCLRKTLFWIARLFQKNLKV